MEHSTYMVRGNSARTNKRKKMKEFVVEVRRFGEIQFSARYSAKSFSEAAIFAGAEYLAVAPTELLPDRLGEKFNPGWKCFSLRRSIGFRVLVKEA